jgi:DNA-binding MarR family transcriptional regulator
MYKLKFTLLQQEILRFLSIKSGLSFNARRLSQYLNVSQTAIAKSLPLLERNGFIQVVKDKESGRLAIELDRENQRIIQFKRAENLKLIYESGLVEFLKQKFPETQIILSGLYSKGEDIYSSNIDIVIIDSKKNLNLDNFDKILERHINLVFYDSLKKIDNKFLVGGIGL